eukprot:366155-Chlamydomonas_euryale.AAC.3
MKQFVTTARKHGSLGNASCGKSADNLNTDHNCCRQGTRRGGGQRKGLQHWRSNQCEFCIATAAGHPVCAAAPVLLEPLPSLEPAAFVLLAALRRDRGIAKNANLRCSDLNQYVLAKGAISTSSRRARLHSLYTDILFAERKSVHPRAERKSVRIRKEHNQYEFAKSGHQHDVAKSINQCDFAKSVNQYDFAKSATSAPALPVITHGAPPAGWSNGKQRSVACVSSLTRASSASLPAQPQRAHLPARHATVGKR